MVESWLWTRGRYLPAFTDADFCLHIVLHDAHDEALLECRRAGRAAPPRPLIEVGLERWRGQSRMLKLGSYEWPCSSAAMPAGPHLPVPSSR